MPHVHIPGGKSFEAHAGESLLDAALRANVLLEHSCKTGRCGSCRARLINGEIRPSSDETALSDIERQTGWILTCVRQIADSDIEVAVDELGEGIILPAARTLPCRIQTITRVAPDVVHVVLRLPPGTQFDFLPGQYVDIIGPAGIRRSYSLAAAPSASHTIELYVRAVARGEMSRYWFESAAVNDLLRLRGPLGTFFLRNVANRHLVFLATGTGIAPVKAMVEGMALLPTASLPASCRVYWGGRTPADHFWAPDRQHGQIAEFINVLSRAAPEWRGERGHVQAAMLRGGFDTAKTEVYACGSDAMVRQAREQLQSEGLSASAFHSDAFVCSAPTLLK